MSAVPMKRYYRGQDVDTLPRETLLEIIDMLQEQLKTAGDSIRSIVEINELGRKARQKFRS